VRNCDQIKLEWSYIRLHLLLAIFVTAPVFHVDTSWLNTDAPLNTAREGATKKRKTNPPQTTKKVPFQKHKNKIAKRVRIVIRWNSSGHIQKHNNGKRGHREGERVHLLFSIVFTAPVFHFDTSELNTDIDWNTSRGWATQIIKNNPPQTTNRYRFKKQIGTVSKHKTKEQNVWELWSDDTRIVVFKILHGGVTT